MVTEQKLKQIAQKVMSISTADQTEVILSVSENGLTRFANSQIHQNVAWEDVGISVRVVLGKEKGSKRVGVSGTNSFSSEALGRVVNDAIAIAQLQKPDPFFDSLPQPLAISPVNQQTFVDTPAERADAVMTIIRKARAEKITASGSLSSGISELAIANSLGVWAYHTGSSADLSTILLGETSTGFGAQVARRARELDAEKVADTAIRKVKLGQNPRDVEPGEWEVILEPQAVNEMLTFFAFYGPNARLYNEQASCLSGKLGQKVFNAQVSIIDDALDKDAFPIGFDFEGYPKKRVEIINKGVFENLLYDSYHAARYGAHNTGHALPAPNTSGPIPLHLSIAPGTKSKEQMIRNVRKGILVTRLWYVRVLNPRSLSLTGMTRDGTFLIENGEIVGGVKNLRFNQSVPEMFAQVVDIENTLTALSSFESEIGISRIPSMHVAGWTFSSGTLF